MLYLILSIWTIISILYIYFELGKQQTDFSRNPKQKIIDVILGFPGFILFIIIVYIYDVFE